MEDKPYEDSGCCCFSKTFRILVVRDMPHPHYEIKDKLLHPKGESKKGCPIADQLLWNLKLVYSTFWNNALALMQNLMEWMKHTAFSVSRVGGDMQLTEARKLVELSLDSLSWDPTVLEVSVVKKDRV